MRATRPGLIQWAWYRRLGVEPPFMETRFPVANLARLLPYRWRRFHRWFATHSHYFWLPCPICGHEFGGHESGSSIPDPTRGEGTGLVICSECTRRRQ